MSTSTTKTLSSIIDRVQTEREEAIAAWSTPGSMRLPVRALSLRAAIYCVVLFTVAEFGLEYEAMTCLVVAVLSSLAAWHGGQNWMFVLLVGGFGALAETIVVNMPSKAWRYQLRATSSLFAQTIGIPLWLPCVWSAASTCVSDMLRFSLRLQFLLQAKLPPK